ncbi:hypothetical protein NJC38_19490 [Pseudomonas sp. 21LCFQ010]|uniref:DUF6124 family protein n=1 Tax=Pseudomonas sp. 21LCFQ010 TaxID=2957506 RepID=UPI0020968ABF|nr:hypothetical protein [Pseudomonas sp. 21LCFQ010]MCO8164331.1 hypothetical protein [Pseudomonas sp. 21LCFQ010]
MTMKLVPDPPSSTTRPDSGPTLISFEDQLNSAWDVLSCAYATAYECGDSLHGQQRNLAMAAVHLVAQAQAMLEQMIEHLPKGVGVGEGG